MATAAYNFGQGAVPVISAPSAVVPQIPGFSTSNKRTAQTPYYNAQGLVQGYSTAAPFGSSDAADNTSGQVPGYLPASPGNVPVNLANQPPNNPSNDFSLISVTKNPAVQNSAQNLQQSSDQTQQQTAKTFNDYLTEATQLAQQNAGTLAANQTTLATAPAQYAAQLAAINNQLEQENAAAVGTQTAANTQYANTAQNLIGQSQADIQAGTQAIYDRAGNALTYATDQNKLGKAASGTPGSLGGADIEAAAQAYQNAYVPAEIAATQEKLQNVYGFQQPIAQSEQQQGTALAQTQLGVAGQQAQTQTAAAGLVNNLKTSIAEGNYSINDAVQYLTSLGLPIQMAQGVLSGNVSNEQAISALLQSNAFQGLATNYQQPTVAFPTYNSGQPGVTTGTTPFPTTTGTGTNGYFPAPNTGTTTGSNGYTPAQLGNQQQIQQAGQALGYGLGQMPSSEDLNTIAQQTGLPLSSVQAFYSSTALPTGAGYTPANPGAYAGLTNYASYAGQD